MIIESRGDLVAQAAYWDVVRAVPGGTVSPGGAAVMLGVSRQRIQEIVKLPGVRAWVFHYPFSVQAAYMEISVRDIVAYGFRVGRIKSIDEVPLIGEDIKRQVIELLNDC